MSTWVDWFWRILILSLFLTMICLTGYVISRHDIEVPAINAGDIIEWMDLRL